MFHPIYFFWLIFCWSNVDQFPKKHFLKHCLFLHPKTLQALIAMFTATVSSSRRRVQRRRSETSCHWEAREQLWAMAYQICWWMMSLNNLLGYSTRPETNRLFVCCWKMMVGWRCAVLGYHLVTLLLWSSFRRFSGGETFPYLNLRSELL